MVSISQSFTPSNSSGLATLLAGNNDAACERAISDAARSDCGMEREAGWAPGVTNRRTGARSSFSPGFVFTSMEDACTSLGLLKRAAASKELLLELLLPPLELFRAVLLELLLPPLALFPELLLDLLLPPLELVPAPSLLNRDP